MSSTRRHPYVHIQELQAQSQAHEALNLMTIDAAMALSRSAVRTLMMLSPNAAEYVRSFVQEEMDRIDMDCTEEGIGSIAIMRDAITTA